MEIASFMIWVTGCNRPGSGLLPGKVRSGFPVASDEAVDLVAERFACLASKRDSTSFFIVFASCPSLGRSSAATEPSCFMILVN